MESEQKIPASKNISKENKRIISYSKNVFLPITNLCRNKCAYCGFKKTPDSGAWILSEKEVLDLTKKGLKKGCSEAMVTLGERPETYKMMEKWLEKQGYSTTIDYLVHLSSKILDVGLLPHVNPGVIEESEMTRLKKCCASMGLMLECATELPVHKDSPGKDPETRLAMIEKAGEMNIPFTTGILVGIGESWKDRVKSLMEIRKIQEKHGHIQEVIIQPFIPKKGTQMENKDPPDHIDILNTINLAKNIMPKMSLQVPPNLTENLMDLLEVGVNDLGGISPITHDYINPENPWPKIEEIKSELSKSRFKLKERLPIYPEFAKNSKFMSQKIENLVKSMIEKNGYRKIS